MTIEEQSIRRVLDIDEAQAQLTLSQINAGSRASNGHAPTSNDRHAWASFVAEREESVRQARAKPVEERTPFEQLGIDAADRRTRLTGTPELEAEESDTRRTIEQMAHAKPLTMDDPLREIVGMVSSDDGMTDVAENHDHYLAEAYADLHEDDDRL